MHWEELAQLHHGCFLWMHNMQPWHDYMDIQEHHFSVSSMIRPLLLGIFLQDQAKNWNRKNFCVFSSYMVKKHNLCNCVLLSLH